MDVLAADNFDIEKIVEDIERNGATSLKILKEDFRESLLEEAGKYDYKKGEEIVGKGDRAVMQQMGSFENFPEGSLYFALRDSFQSLFYERLTDSTIRPFETPLSFNSMVLQRYDKDSIGITPHRDHMKYVNLVSIFNIGGRGRFYVCRDRKGNNSRELDASPGNAIILRAPGFLSGERPFHYVTDIQQARYTFGLRQRK